MIKRILVVLLVLGALLPLSSSAQTADEIAKLIAELSRQIAALKVQLAQLQGNQSGQWCFTFEKNLGVGAGGKEVDALHAVLVKEGISISPMPVPVNTTLSEMEKDKEKSKAAFTEATAAAVSAFQLKYRSEILAPLGLANPTGYVGPSTRAVLNRLYGCKKVVWPIPVPGNLTPSISGVSGPTTLNVGQAGTWTVNASDPENGTLSYSVIWGDEGGTTAAAPTGSAVQQTATFTHSYATAGTYYPKFKVTDNAGQSNSTSLSVVVGQTSLITVISPNGGERWVANSVQPITWRYNNATSATKVDLYLGRAWDCPPGMVCEPFTPMYILLDKNIAANTTYNWIVATDIVNNPIPVGHYHVGVCFSGSERLVSPSCDWSDNYFTIVAQ